MELKKIYTHNFQLGSPSSLFVSDSIGNFETFDLLQASSMFPIPDIYNEAQVKDEHISTVHGVPSKAHLLDTDVPTSFDVQEAWLILVFLDLPES